MDDTTPPWERSYTCKADVWSHSSRNLEDILVMTNCRSPMLIVSCTLVRISSDASTPSSKCYSCSKHVGRTFSE